MVWASASVWFAIRAFLILLFTLSPVCSLQLCPSVGAWAGRDGPPAAGGLPSRAPQSAVPLQSSLCHRWKERKKPLEAESPDAVAVSAFIRRLSPAGLRKHSCGVRCRAPKCLTDGERGKQARICSELWKVCKEGILGQVCFCRSSAHSCPSQNIAVAENLSPTHCCRGKCRIWAYVYCICDWCWRWVCVGTVPVCCCSAGGHAHIP